MFLSVAQSAIILLHRISIYQYFSLSFCFFYIFCGSIAKRYQYPMFIHNYEKMLINLCNGVYCNQLYLVKYCTLFSELILFRYYKRQFAL